VTESVQDASHRVAQLRVRVIRPPAAEGTLPVILYMHGGGWVLGGTTTHDRLVRELAVGTGAALVFVEYRGGHEPRPVRPVTATPGGSR
jgi:acetyl esterase